MEEKDIAEILFKLAEQKWQEYNSRRSYEWKVNFGIWAGIGIFSGFCIKENIRFDNILIIILLSIFYIVMILVYYIFRRGISKSCNDDQIERFKYIDKIHEILDLNKTEKPKELIICNKKVNILKLNWSHITQLFITILILLISFFGLIFGNNCR
jgi:hypothetical protein